MNKREILVQRIANMRKLHAEILSLKDQLMEKMDAATDEYKIGTKRTVGMYEELDIDLCKVLGDLVLEEQKEKEE